MKPGYFVGGALIVICIVVTAMALSGSVRRTVSFQEALASQQPCEVYGKVLKETARFADDGRFTFRIQELHSPAELQVVSLKPKPSNFDQATDVKAIGQVRGDVFVATDLLVKCPSKYVTEGKSERADRPEAGAAELKAALGVSQGEGRSRTRDKDSP